MSKKLVRHHYTECGLPNIWIECFRVRDDAGNDTFIIPKVRRLHQLISQAIVMSGRALRGPEIRFLRSEMGLTREEFGRLVRRETATVARWEHGHSAPDEAVDVLIRFIATAKLGLKNVDLKESVDKWETFAGVKSGAARRIRINAANPGAYRLVA
ncbi:MAG: putative Transcriptional regulator [Arenicellales bacterium IbO2]|nr:MAG: putative Transcriptional regulator [Arenicellales bacterium IbO2]